MTAIIPCFAKIKWQILGIGRRRNYRKDEVIEIGAIIGYNGRLCSRRFVHGEARQRQELGKCRVGSGNYINVGMRLFPSNLAAFFQLSICGDEAKKR
jgi:hypothetical protein